MVLRTESSGKIDEFVATVTAVTLEQGVSVDRKQYHVFMTPEGIEIKGETKQFHEWIPMSPKATDTQIPQGSVMDRYLQQIEICIPAAKKEPSVALALNLLVGKKFKFQKVKLGKDFDGHPAREYAVPVQAVN
jgi:hypothetical protein